MFKGKTEQKHIQTPTNWIFYTMFLVKKQKLRYWLSAYEVYKHLTGYISLKCFSTLSSLIIGKQTSITTAEAAGFTVIIGKKKRSEVQLISQS